MAPFKFRTILLISITYLLSTRSTALSNCLIHQLRRLWTERRDSMQPLVVEARSPSPRPIKLLD